MAQASKVVVVNNVNSFENQFKESNSTHSILFFWAEWHKPCQQLTAVIEQLSLDHPHLIFYSIDAESYSEISEKYNISSVPTIIFCINQKETQRLEAMDAPTLVNAVSKYSKQAATQQKLIPNKQASKNNQNNNADNNKAKNNNNNNDNNSNQETEEQLNKRLGKLINAAPIMLFMKGSPDNPRCKFSRAMIETLKGENIGRFGYFDILTDNSVRQGLKTYSNWKTYPQLYINGKLIGGLDIVKEMIEENEFQDALPKKDDKNSKENELNKRLKKLINEKPIMLFMKGTPNNPMCGFSAQIVQLLSQENVKDYGTFNILDDMDVRQGLKKYSDWPTYPQLYINGKLIGGLDIVKEMIEEDEFQDALPQ